MICFTFGFTNRPHRRGFVSIMFRESRTDQVQACRCLSIRAPSAGVDFKLQFATCFTNNSANRKAEVLVGNTHSCLAKGWGPVHTVMSQ